MLFITNKYTTWYNNIIKHAQARILSENVYSEKHHIIPKSMGGSNAKDNLVRLTAREHFICHWLLTKMTVGELKHKMIYAAWSMVRKSKGQDRYNMTSRTFDSLKNQLSQAKKGKTPWNKGKTYSDETKAKMSALKKGTYVPWNKGLGGTYEFSEESKAKMSAAQKGRVFSDEHRLKLSLVQKGKPKSEETKRKLSEAIKAKYAAKQQGK
jgi:hypothetical protein